MKEIINNEKYLYTLEENERGSLYLEVLCGGVGMYTVRIELNAEERAGYAEEGEEFLNELARTISWDSTNYLKREVRRP